MSETGADETTARIGADRSVDDDRRRQMAAAAWILGFIGGPLPAIFVAVVADRGSWNRRCALWAAVYWTAAWVVIMVMAGLTVSDSVDGEWPRAVAVGTVLVSLMVTALAAWQAARRSRRGIDRQRATPRTPTN